MSVNQLFSIGLVLIGITSNPTLASTQVIPSTELNTIALKQAPSSPMPDGTYLYGQSSQPNEIGKEYVVFEAHNGKVMGALYMPSSEFRCFQGTVASQQMNLMVMGAEGDEGTRVAMKPQQVAAAGNQLNLDNNESASYPYAVNLQDFQPINQVSDSDRQILNVCRSDS